MSRRASLKLSTSSGVDTYPSETTNIPCDQLVGTRFIFGYVIVDAGNNFLALVRCGPMVGFLLTLCDNFLTVFVPPPSRTNNLNFEIPPLAIPTVNRLLTEPQSR
jgi:hypothetical protein